MSGPEDRHAQSLADWLEIATRKLSAAAMERIRLEIEAHYAEGIENHKTNGCSETEAQAAVLAELGKSSAAAKRFRRRHLTEREARRVEGLLKLPGWTNLFSPVIAALGFLLFAASKPPNFRFVVGALAAVLIVLASFCFCAARRWSSKRDIRLLFLAEKLNDVSFTFFIAAFLAWGHCFFFIALMFIEIIALIRDLRFWFKLGQIDKVVAEIPTRGAAAS